MSTEVDTPAALRQRITDLERELRHKDQRIAELRGEVDTTRDLVRRMEEHAQEDSEYLEHFISTFGMEQDDEGCWRWGKLITDYNSMIDRNVELRDKFNRLVELYNRFAMPPQPVGRPVAASTAQQAQVLKLRKRGLSLRDIAEETSLGLPTVRTIIGKHDGSDRSTNKRRQQFGLEPKPKKDWRPAAIRNLPKRVTAHFEKGRELAKEAKGLR